MTSISEDEIELDKVFAVDLERVVAGYLKSTIDAHGTIGHGQIPSAAKRIAHGVKGALVQKKEQKIEQMRSTIDVRNESGGTTT